MNIQNELADEAILAEMGVRLKQRRLDQQLTQAELARQAGVAKKTLERIEAGHSGQMLNMIRIFRVLNLLDNLDTMIPTPADQPIALLKKQHKRRQRASRRKPPTPHSPPWQWGEDT